MLIFTVVWPFVAVLLILLLAVAVLQERVKRRLAAPQRRPHEPSLLPVSMPAEPLADLIQLDTVALSLADTPA